MNSPTEKEAVVSSSNEKQAIAPSQISSSDIVLESADDGIHEPSLLRKLDRTLLPAVTALYLLSFLDRSNVANARLDGLVTDLHMSGDQYLTGLTLYFIGYVLFEIPCNIILKRTSPKIWLPTLTLAWGVVATLMGVTQNLAGFYVVRFVLGVTESGLFPGVVFYLSFWYKRNERQFRVALFFSAASLAGAFGGILAYGIGFMKGVGGLNGWRWIFIIEGLVTVVVSLAAYFFICNYPDTAPFLSDRERSFIHARLKADSDATQNEAFTWANVRSALADPKCWLYGFAFHTMSLPLYTLSLFLVGNPSLSSKIILSKFDPPPMKVFTNISLLANYHQRPRLYRCRSPAPHRSPLRPRYDPYHCCLDSLPTSQNPLPHHPRLHLPQHPRLHLTFV